MMDLNLIRDKLNDIPDPEIPVLTLGDLGIIHNISEIESTVKVEITPTYSGCPATRFIEQLVKETLVREGIENYQVVSKISPVWTTDWMSEEGKRKLKQYGIAPPNKSLNKPKECPQCESENVELISEFGSTPCQAYWRCSDCQETFTYFKCH